jgi:hypothetical protein
MQPLPRYRMPVGARKAVQGSVRSKHGANAQVDRQA